MLACHSYISGAGVRDGFYRKAYISFFLVLLCLGDSGRCGYDGISRKAVAEISPCVVVAWLLPRDFGGSHDYVCRRPERICTSYCREQGKQLCGAGERAGDRFALYIALDSFRVEYYPGTEAPADYISHIRVLRPGQGADSSSCSRTVSMNRILSEQGFRFYQSSFDEDRQGSWLTVNHDPWGIGITYAGYILLGISMIGMLFGRRGEFRRLMNHPLLKRGACSAFCCWREACRCRDGRFRP